MATGQLPKATAVKKEMTDDTGETEDESGPSSRANAPPVSVITVDACGLQCPGPIQKLKEAVDGIEPGQGVAIISTDPAFAADVGAWCQTTGHRLVDVKPDRGRYTATVVKCLATAGAAAATERPAGKGMTIVVFSGDYDKAMAAFVIANGAAAMGIKPTMFFTFWGINALRRDAVVAVPKTLIERMFGWMMPRGAERLALSRMHMAGIGRTMIKGIMRKKNVASLSRQIADAQRAGVRLVVCAMSMDLMGIKPEELIDGVEAGGVATYLNRADAGNINLFI